MIKQKQMYEYNNNFNDQNFRMINHDLPEIQPHRTLLASHAYAVQYVGLENPQHLETVRQSLDYF